MAVFLVTLITFSTSVVVSFSAASRSSPTPSPAVDKITDSSSTSKSGINFTILIPTVTAAAVLALFLALFSMVWFRCFRFQKNRVVGNDAEVDVESNLEKEEEEFGVRRFSWDEVTTLTNGFEKVIDRGGFSVVYYGALPFNPTASKTGVGAFKVHNSSERLNQGFKEELSILLTLNHPNIVRLHGYCDDQASGALVFEYVENGTLQENLHSSRAEENENSLKWGTRVSIAYQLALALEYLHEKRELHVVHGDIKSSNILLDSSLKVKLCDFGSAKMGFSAGLAPSRKHLITGSPGYVDPHYLRTGISSKKNDIYSFGVVLMELLTGMEAFCDKTGRILTSRVENGSGRMSLDLVDPRLGEECEVEEWLVMGDIAGMCLRGSPSLRPSASEVISVMRQKVRVMGFDTSR